MKPTPWQIDYDDVLCLGNGWHVMIATRGRRRVLFLTDGSDGVLDPLPPPHEQTGPLPRGIRAAIETVRCGGVRLDGGRCRTPVGRPGDHCHWHRDQTRRRAAQQAEVEP